MKKLSTYVAAVLLLVAFKSQAQIPVQSDVLKGKKILFVVTSHADLGNSGKKTGVWMHEFAEPYYILTDQGAEVTIVSPKGGKTPVDPKSLLPDFSTPATKRFLEDKKAQSKLDHALLLSTASQAKYDAVFYPGGHGPMWDLAGDETSAKLIESFYQHNKPISFVCHAPVALKSVRDKNGELLIKGKTVSGFTNTEEEGVQLTTTVPFLLEDMLKQSGANYQRGADWQPFAVSDGLLITGQNPASAALVAEKLTAQLITK
jgi:putative intracellular protease/amidase